MFFNEFLKHPSNLTLRQYGGLNHTILHLRDLLHLSWCWWFLGLDRCSTVFLSVSEYIGIDSLKTTSLEEMSEICLAIALGISLIIVGG